MAERILAPGVYVLVFAIMIGLTCVSIGVSFLNLALVWHDLIGLIIATCKATLVVLFFMHVLYSSRLTWIVIVVAVFWMGLLLVLTFSDYLSRGMLSHMPGH
jgi:cytochrome c oxidase subunit IV